MSEKRSSFYRIWYLYAADMTPTIFFKMSLVREYETEDEQNAVLVSSGHGCCQNNTH